MKRSDDPRSASYSTLETIQGATPKTGPSTPGKRQPESLLFVDNVRFWSMFAVVAIHSTQVFVETGHPRQSLIEVIETPFKFASIAFFLIAGFLAVRGIETLDRWLYFKRRVGRLFLPWCLWLAAMIAGFVGTDFLHHRIPYALNGQFFSVVEARVVYCLFSTAFWFVPNFLFSLVILLLFRRVRDSAYFGLSLLCFSLFYGVNIYNAWAPRQHTEAIFGFVFYLWLGSYAARHRSSFERWTTGISLPLLLTAVAISGVLAYGECRLLDKYGAADPLNSLRITNQLFSVLAVLFLYKLRRASWPAFVDVRFETFGVYLIHSLVLLLFWPLLKSRHFARLVAHLCGSTAGSIALWAAVLMAGYGLALLATKLLLKRPGLRWTVGMAASRDRSPQAAS